MEAQETEGLPETIRGPVRIVETDWSALDDDARLRGLAVDGFTGLLDQATIDTAQLMPTR